MLTTLKAMMRNDVEFKSSLESSIDTVVENNDDIRSIFLDNPDAMVIGAENDPEIKKLVDSLPDDVNEETNDVTDKDIEDIIEGFVPMSMLTEAIDDGAEDYDAGDFDDDGDYDQEVSETDLGEDQDDIEDAADKSPVKESDDSDDDDDDESDDDDDDESDDDDLDDDFDFDLIESVDNILGDKQDEIEDAPDKDPTKSQPYSDNIDGEDQDDIEDAPDKAPVKESDNFDIDLYDLL